MADTPINLDDDPELEVVSLYTLCRKYEIAWHYRGTLEEWVTNPEIPTPKPKLKVNGEYHWEPTEEVIEQFKYLIKCDEWLDAEKRYRALESVGIRADVLVELLIEDAKNVERLNARCYNRNRGNSMQDGRMRSVMLDGKKEFLGKVLSHLEIDLPPHKSRELNDLIRKAKDHVNIR